MIVALVKITAAGVVTAIVLNLCYEFVRRRLGGLRRGREMTQVK
jgi:hypothetical protein